MRKTYLFGTAILTAVFLLGNIPFAEARHNSGGFYSSSVQRKIDKLDDDEVEEFAIPVLFGIDLSDITPNFGDPRDGGARTHEGLDIMGKRGVPIVSPTEAVVTSTGDGESSGKYVRTANPGGESFVYMHLDEIANIKTGDVLRVGDLIGMVGDTGNAKGGPAHLHFEVREGKAKDPYERVKEQFTLEEKMEFVVTMFKDLDDEDDVAEFLVSNFTAEFKSALNAGYELPDEIEKELKERGIVSTKDLEEKLASVLKMIPSVLTTGLAQDAQGTQVSLLQFYLIYEGDGPAAAKLTLSGATGYFGPATAAALMELQGKLKVPATGVFDQATKDKLTQ